MQTVSDYELIRSSRKTVAVEVKSDGRVIVRAPLRMPRERIEAFVSSHSDWIAKHVVRALDRYRPDPSPEEEARLRALAKSVLPGRVEYYAGIMKVTPTRLTITGARTRFGSCSGKNGISFSWRLMQYPPEAVDYVVVHELAHIKQHNHSKKFYAEIAKVLPDHEARRALLKR